MHKITIKTLLQCRVMSFGNITLKDHFMKGSPDDFLGHKEEPDIYYSEPSDNLFLCLKTLLKSAIVKQVYNPDKTAAGFRGNMFSKCHVS